MQFSVRVFTPGYFHTGPCAGSAREMKLCADGFGALAHDTHAKAGRLGGGGVEANAVVADFKTRARWRETQIDIYLGSTRIFEYIVQTLLSNAVIGNLNLWW